MENITLGQINGIMLFLATFIGTGIILSVYIKKALKLALKDELEPIKKQQTDNSMAIRRNELMRVFHILKSSGELDSDEKMHYHKTYDEYTKEGGNSYIKELNDKYVMEEKI